jgi:hypothetical protein
MHTIIFSSFLFLSRNVKQRLQLLDEQPFIVRDICPIELLKRINTCPAYQRIERVFLFKVSAICGLVGTHFDFHGYGWLSLFADLNLFVIPLNARSIISINNRFT